MKRRTLIIHIQLTLALLGLALSLFHPILHSHPLDLCDHHSQCLACEIAFHLSGQQPLPSPECPTLIPLYSVERIIQKPRHNWFTHKQFARAPPSPTAFL